MRIKPSQQSHQRANSADPELVGGDGVGSKMQRLVYSKEDLIVSVSNLLKIHSHEIKYRKTPLGQFLSIFTKSVDPNWIEIDGMRINQILEFSGERQSVPLNISQDYQVEVEGLKELISKIEADRPT